MFGTILYVECKIKIIRHEKMWKVKSNVILNCPKKNTYNKQNKQILQKVDLLDWQFTYSVAFDWKNANTQRSLFHKVKFFSFFFFICQTIYWMHTFFAKKPSVLKNTECDQSTWVVR